jgi:hypothetical protein
LLNVLLQIANKLGLYAKKLYSELTFHERASANVAFFSLIFAYLKALNVSQEQCKQYNNNMT